MATWHQKRNPTPLSHETEYTVVSDPPNQLLCLNLFSTKEEAEKFLQKLKKRGEADHCYILPPYQPRR